MKKRNVILTALLLAVTMLFSACATKDEYATTGNLFGNGEASDSVFLEDSVPAEAPEGTVELTSQSSASGERKIIKSFSYTLETKDLDAAVLALEAAIAQCGGYYESAQVYGNTEEGGNAEFVLRVPAAQAEKFGGDLSSIGNIVSQSKKGDDVTTAYYDTEAQLDSLKIQQERLMALLEKAETLEDILLLETELTRVRTEIERLTTVLVRYDDLVEYSTVSVYVRQVQNYTEPEPDSFGTRIAETFRSSLEFAEDVMETIVIVVVWLAPLLIFSAVVFVVIFAVVKTSKKKKRSGKAKKAEIKKESSEDKEDDSES